MRRVRHMADECRTAAAKGESLLFLAKRYFDEMTTIDLLETRELHPAREQTEFVFREIDNRWKQFCHKTGLGFNEGAFMSWANGKPFSLLGSGL